MKVITIFCISLVVTLAQTTPVMDFTNSNKIFTADLYKELKKNETGNFLISPFSAQIILALTESGSRGSSSQELRQTLHLPSESHLAINSILSDIKNLDPNFHLHTANKIYVGKNLLLKDDFKERAVKSYEADIEVVDFSSNVVSLMNSWVANQTRNKISNLLQPSDIRKTTVAVLVNALYLQARWLKEFEPSETRKANFYASNSTIEVETMFKNQHFMSYREDKDLKAKFAELPLKGYEASVVFVLPDERNGLGEIENKPEIFSQQDFSFTKVNLAIPKFKIESKIDFKELLQNLGVTKIFSLEADLSGIAGEPGDLFVDKVVQKVFIDVNEEGVEAAAATALLPIAGSAFIPDPPKEFIADHPFVFYVKAKGVILFAGRVMNPIK